jgi:transposase
VSGVSFRPVVRMLRLTREECGLMPRQYSPQFRERVVRLVNESVGEHETQWATIQRVSSRLGVSGETVRKWVRQAEVNAGLPSKGPCAQSRGHHLHLRSKNSGVWRINHEISFVVWSGTPHVRRRVAHCQRHGPTRGADWQGSPTCRRRRECRLR